MIEASLAEIERLARDLHSNGKTWHFHILTPDCALNDGDQCVFVLEDIDSKAIYAYHSSKPEKQLGQELLPLLHGKKILDNTQPSGQAYKPSAAVEQMVACAKELNDQHTPWHHHVLFPRCSFNEHPGQWTLIFEDPMHKRLLQNPSLEEPVNDLKLIEPLFYALKR